ncbi:phospholipid phosphatase [Intrasporangium oryzae NRRL B-24470]|uniref:Phospholipid phosphatase n=1 Tax=Intrasporangium oryzae NRRL B-24470 TaxID=1386089 RepID=W9GEI4_9MICO|nr:phosphatase PAP2 family protein [Intrasporangium oryzae]EWT03238.1 phospholipid phosphatase [Intrasporangium oryzae NRRL B-24470]
MNHPVLHRYEIDPTRPAIGSALRDLGLRVAAPAVVLFAIITGLGFLIVGPLGDLKSETSVNKTLQDTRSATWDAVTAVWSHIGNTEIIIGVCVIVVAILWWRTKQWWYAVIPAIAIATQASVFVAATTVVGRDRPQVPHLDPAPPTSSYPSGHVGASTALYVTFALMAQRIERAWLRQVVTVVCLVVPFLVAYARLYRGMHHLSDVLVGMLNGLVCVVLAWLWLRRDTSRSGAGVKAARTDQVAEPR